LEITGDGRALHDEAERAVARDATSGAAWRELGRAYQAEGAHALALSAFGQAVLLSPLDAMAWFGLGRARLETDDAKGALEAGQQAVRLAPERPELRLLLARRSGRVGSAGRPSRTWSPPWGSILIWATLPADLGSAYLAVGEREAAAEAFETSLRLEPDQPAVWAELGGCLLKLGRPAKAVHVLETAVFARPDDGTAWTRLGCAYFETGRHADAARAFARGFEAGNDEPWAWYRAGQNAAVLGDAAVLEKARSTLRNATPAWRGRWKSTSKSRPRGRPRASPWPMGRARRRDSRTCPVRWRVETLSRRVSRCRHHRRRGRCTKEGRWVSRSRSNR